MAVGKNKRLTKGKKGAKKKMWVTFTHENVQNYTCICCERTSGSMLAYSQGLGRIKDHMGT